MSPIVKIDAFKCNKCNHIWISHLESYNKDHPPIACASCKSAYWNKEPNKNVKKTNKK